VEALNVEETKLSQMFRKNKRGTSAHYIGQNGLRLPYLYYYFYFTEFENTERLQG